MLGVQNITKVRKIYAVNPNVNGTVSSCYKQGPGSNLAHHSSWYTNSEYTAGILTYSVTYLLHGAVLEKLTGLQLVKKFPAF
jgi:hypothetical protein